HHVQVLKKGGKTVELRVRKDATEKEPFIAETIYTLSDGEEFIRVRTTYENTSDKTIKILINDVLRCDNGLEDITPAGEGTLAFIYNKWYHSAYGVISADRRLYTFGIPEEKGLATLGHQIFYEDVAEEPGEKATLRPGQKIIVSRMLVTGENIVELQQLQNSLTSSKYQPVKVQVADELKSNLSGVNVEARNDKNEIVSSSLTDHDGNAVLMLPLGDFNINVSKIGHGAVSKSILVKENTSPINVELHAESKISFTVRDENNQVMPVKIEFRGIKGTRKP